MVFHPFRYICILAVILMLTVPVRASFTLVALNTQDTGEGLVPGDSDPNYQLVSFTAVPVLGLTQDFTVPEHAVVVNPNPAWLANGTNDKWIGATVNQTGGGTANAVPPGTYDFELTPFLVPVGSTGVIQVSGMAAADNAWSITYGASETASGDGTILGNKNYTALVPFSFSYNATPGAMSQIDFIVQNANDTGNTVNDSGFIVNDLLITTVPEPAQSMTIGLIMTLVLVGAHRAWRRGSQAVTA